MTTYRKPAHMCNKNPLDERIKVMERMALLLDPVEREDLIEFLQNLRPGRSLKRMR